MPQYVSESTGFDCAELEDCVPMPFSREHLGDMLEVGVPYKMALHHVKLFSFDALSIFEDQTDDEEGSIDHLLLHLGLIWSTVRLRSPPTMDDEGGWRVEFRPLEN